MVLACLLFQGTICAQTIPPTSTIGEDPSFYQVNIEGIELWAHPNVHSPKYFRSTEIYAKHFPFRPDEDLLEIGTAIGTTAILAAKRFNNRVVAVDINPDAVITAQKNVAFHGLEQKVAIRKGNVFSTIKATEAFDTIYWDLPCLYAPPSEVPHMHKLVLYDPGYQATKRFFKGARKHLKPGGRIIVSFSSAGDYSRLVTLSESQGYQLRKIHESSENYPARSAYYLYQLTKI